MHQENTINDTLGNVSEAARALVHLLAILELSVDPDDLILTARACGLTNRDGRKISKVNAAKTLIEVKESPAVTSNARGQLSIVPGQANSICANLAGTSSTLEAIKLPLLKWLTGPDCGFEKFDQLNIAQRTYYFSGDVGAYQRHLPELLEFWDYDHPVNCVYLFFNFSPDLLDGLSDKILNKVCLLLHNHMLHFMWDQPAFFEFLAQRLDRIASAPEILALFRFLRAEEQDSGLQRFSISQAFTALAKGDYPLAQGHFSDAYKALPGGGRSVILYLPTFAGVFAAISFAANGEVDGFEKSAAICKKAADNKHPATRYFNTFGRFLQVRSGASKVPFDLFFPSSKDFGHSYALQIFVAVIWTKWLGNDLPDAELIKKARLFAQEEGYKRIVAEYDRLFSGDSSFFIDTGDVSLLQVLHKKEEWELKLAQLEKLATATSRPTAGADQTGARLVWEINEPAAGEGPLELQPVLQKKTSTGFTKGRKITLAKLADPMAHPEGCLEQDQRMLSKIKRARDHWYGSNPHYVLDESVWLEAIGHPNIFWQGDRVHPVELVSRSIQLSVEHNDDDSYRIIAPGEYYDGQRIYVKKVSTALIEITEVTPHQQILLSLLSDPLHIPRGNHARLAQVVEKLSATAMIDSEDKSLLNYSKEIDGDATPVIHLSPVADTLRIEFLVQPFGRGVGPVFAPGVGGGNVVAQIKDEHCVALRDLSAEKQNVQATMTACIQLQDAEMQEDNRFVVHGAESSLEFLLELHECKDSVIVKWPKGGAINMRGEVSEDDARLRVGSGTDWFEVSGEIEVDKDQVLQIRELLQLASESSSRFVKMSDGSFIALTDHFRGHLEAMSRMGEIKKDGVRIPQLALPAIDELASHFEHLEVDEGWKASMERIQELDNINPDPSPDFKADLRPYQLEGYRWLCRLAHWGVGACLADDMGLGKTVQALALLLDKAELGPSIVIAPTSVCGNWADEAARFTPSLTTHLLHERKRASGFKDLGPRDVLIASYGLMVNELEALQDISFQVAVLDEAQAIKNPATRRSKAVRKLDAKFRLGMTGTPIENHLGELWSLFRFTNPGLLGSLDKFNQRFANPIERDRNPVVLEQLRSVIQPFILRRHKTEILKELPSKTEIEITITPSPEERAYYESLRQSALESLAGGDESAGNNRFQILAEIMKLRRACCNPQLVDDGLNIASSKLERLLFLVDELAENNHQALIFSQFVGHLDLIREALDAKGITYAYLDGSTSPRERKNQIAAFQAGEYDLFLISLKAGGTGLNLTAADYVIHMDPWWNPAVEDQASDRAHRIGQQRPVTIYRLITQDSIESRIMDLHASKRQLAEDLLSGTQAGSKLSADDLLNLIREL